MNAIKIIYPDGTEKEINKKLTLEEMQKIVGGYIERIPSTLGRRSLIVNEEGALKNLPVNHEATKYCPDHIMRGGPLVGTVILVKS